MQEALGEKLKKSSFTSAKVRRAAPLYEQIYDSLWTLIFKGEISPGERLSDRNWAKKLKTSRTPAREARRKWRAMAPLWASKTATIKYAQSTRRDLNTSTNTARRLGRA